MRRSKSLLFIIQLNRQKLFFRRLLSLPFFLPSEVVVHRVASGVKQSRPIREHLPRERDGRAVVLFRALETKFIGALPRHFQTHVTAYRNLLDSCHRVLRRTRHREHIRTNKRAVRVRTGGARTEGVELGTIDRLQRRRDHEIIEQLRLLILLSHIGAFGQHDGVITFATKRHPVHIVECILNQSVIEHRPLDLTDGGTAGEDVQLALWDGGAAIAVPPLRAVRGKDTAFIAKLSDIFGPHDRCVTPPCDE